MGAAGEGLPPPYRDSPHTSYLPGAVSMVTATERENFTQNGHRTDHRTDHGGNLQMHTFMLLFSGGSLYMDKANRQWLSSA